MLASFERAKSLVNLGNVEDAIAVFVDSLIEEKFQLFDNVKDKIFAEVNLVSEDPYLNR